MKKKKVRETADECVVLMKLHPIFYRNFVSLVLRLIVGEFTITVVVLQIVRGSWTCPTMKWTAMDVSGLPHDLSCYYYYCLFAVTSTSATDVLQ